MNEPHRGYIDLPSLHEFDYKTDLHLSYVRTCWFHRSAPLRTHPFPASAFQSFMLASGYPTSVGYWTRSFPFPTRRTAYNVLNPMGRKAWRKDGPTDGKCVWEMHGVWGYDLIKKEGVVLRENYFVKHPMTGKKVTSYALCFFALAHFHQVDWYTDFYFPFVRRWSERVSMYTPNGENKLLFLEPIPNEVPVQLMSIRIPLTLVSSSVHHRGRQSINLKVWCSLHTGTISRRYSVKNLGTSPLTFKA
jgi:hypothetical protein